MLKDNAAAAIGNNRMVDVTKPFLRKRKTSLSEVIFIDHSPILKGDCLPA
jgi:hypothetical protein